MSGRRGARWSGRTWAVVVAVTVVVLSILGVPVEPVAGGMRGTETPRPAAGAAPAERQPTDVLPAGGSWTVTLLTGDVVEVAADDEGRVRTRMRDGSAAVASMRLPTGEVYVFPHSVTHLLDDVLDHELFNVVGLIRQGYDDAAADSIPLIVQRQPGADVDVQTSLRAAADEQPLPSIDAVAVTVPKAGVRALAELTVAQGGDLHLDGLAKVWLDRKVSAPPLPEADAAGTDAAAPLDHNLTQIGADRAWAQGFDGEGVRVGILDTGIDVDHPDLAGQVVALENFARWSEDPVDRVGHGTHVAATVAGTGAAANGARTGVAPAADLVVGKVLDDYGLGITSDIIAGMEWAAPQTDVINMSLGGSMPSDGTDPFSLALDNLSDQYGTLFVVAAGNSGPDNMSVGVPAAADRALTVGAVDGEDHVTEWSSRGPLAGSWELKPEVVAPGLEIVAARAAHTSMGHPVGQHYTAASGTSMATPHAAGAAALLAEAHPDWSPTQLKNQLVGSADPVEGDGHATGAGRIDIGTAVAAGLRSERDVVDVALPHPRTDAHTETLTWTNSGAETIVLTFDTALRDRDEDPVDALSVAPAELSIAPGATGSAMLRIDAAALDTGRYAGMVTATAGDGSTVRTPVAVHAAGEMADLTLRSTRPAAFPDSGWATFGAVVNLDDIAEYADWVFYDGDESPTLRVPVGTYAVVGEVSSYGQEHRMAAQAGDPDVEVDGDMTVTLDGAAAVPFNPTVSGVATAPPTYGEAMAVVTPKAGAGGQSFQFDTRPGGYPFSPIWVTPMEGDPEVFSSHTMFRLQALPFSARVGDEQLEVTTVPLTTEPPAGNHALTTYDMGDGQDLTGARGGLAVVRLPADATVRAEVTQRALDAGVAMLAFVDESRPRLTLPWAYPRFADIPVITLGGGSASRLVAAGQGRETVTVTAVASPYVYDIVRTERGRIDPAPVVTRAEQATLARIDESFHRDPDGTGPTADTRGPLSLSVIDGYLHSMGPIPERRTGYVTPDVVWQSTVDAWGLEEQFGSPYLIQSSVTGDAGRTYRARSRQSVTWLDRPQAPGPVGGPVRDPFCQPDPTTLTADTLSVWLAPQQEARDRFGCIGSPPEATLALARDGVEIGRADDPWADFPIPAGPGTYRLTYDQSGQAPYAYRNSTVWTFRSGAPNGETVVPLLVVDYRLPLDTMNRLTGRTAVLSIGQATGARQSLVWPPKVWTSIDDGTTWQPARVGWSWFGSFRVTLPDVTPGTGVSLKVDASDLGGSRVEQTLVDAYTG